MIYLLLRIGNVQRRTRKWGWIPGKLFWKSHEPRAHEPQAHEPRATSHETQACTSLQGLHTSRVTTSSDAKFQTPRAGPYYYGCGREDALDALKHYSIFVLHFMRIKIEWCFKASKASSRPQPISCGLGWDWPEQSNLPANYCNTLDSKGQIVIFSISFLLSRQRNWLTMNYSLLYAR